MNIPTGKILTTLGALLLVLVSFAGTIDDKGQSYTEDGLKRALITYGIARGLNGVISVAQGTEIAIEPLGVGLTLAPGQILDPVNDLVERFSWVVLASGASLGVQRVMIQVTSWYWFGLAMSLALAIAVLLVWKPALVGEKARKLAYRLAIVLVAVRFVIPVIAITNEGLYSAFLSTQYQDATETLQLTADKIEAINAVQTESISPQQSESSFLQKFQQQYQAAASSLDVEQRLQALKDTVAEVSESTLNLIVVFIMQTLLFPLLFLWLSVKLVKSAISF